MLSTKNVKPMQGNLLQGETRETYSEIKKEDSLKSLGVRYLLYCILLCCVSSGLQICFQAIRSFPCIIFPWLMGVHIKRRFLTEDVKVESIK